MFGLSESMSLATRLPQDACHKVSALNGKTSVAELKPPPSIFCYWMGKIKTFVVFKRGLLSLVLFLPAAKLCSGHDNDAKIANGDICPSVTRYGSN